MAPITKAQKTVLPNGIRVLSEEVPYVDSVSVGLWVGSGARWEDDQTYGISHFIEHMLFKGTERRTAKQIADEMDSIGAHINAFTDKEFTCFYAKALKEHLPVAMDVLTDMLQRSLLDPEEMDREKNVVLEEIKRHEDTPEDLVHDLFAQSLWQQHPLGNAVIGTRQTVEAFTQSQIISYMGRVYTPDNLVVAAAGNIAHGALVEMVAQFLDGLSGEKSVSYGSGVQAVKETVRTSKTTEQVHFCTGAAGYPQSDHDKYVLAIVDSVLGGGMSSRLFQEIRERRGLVYAIGSYSASYTEAGLFTVYGGTSPENIDEVLGLIKTEVANVAESGVTDSELERSKNQIRGSLVLGQESMSNRMSRLAKSELYFGRIVPVEEIVGEIMAVTQEDAARVACHLFGDGELALTCIGPFGGEEQVDENE